MRHSLRVSIYALLIAGLGVANVHVALAGGAADVFTLEDADVESATENPAWWKNYHWDKSTIRSSVRSSNTEAIRAVNRWNGRTDLRLPSSTSHTDISILRGNYGRTGWKGLASIKSLARDSHCSNGYCEIRHCHATLNTSYSMSARTQEGVYCMEMGHCFGLDHDSDNGCMNNSKLSTYNYPSAGNVRAINFRY